MILNISNQTSKFVLSFVLVLFLGPCTASAQNNPTQPNAPHNVTLVPGDKELQVSWDHKENARCPLDQYPQDSYQIEYRKDGAPWRNIREVERYDIHPGANNATNGAFQTAKDTGDRPPKSITIGASQRESPQRHYDGAALETGAKYHVRVRAYSHTCSSPGSVVTGPFAWSAWSAVVSERTDGPRVVVSKDHVPVVEGSTATFTAKLFTKPSGNVTVSISSSNSEVTVDTDSNSSGNQTSLTFTSSNWNNAQTVTVAAAHDSDTSDDTAALTLDPSGATYNHAPNTKVDVTVSEDDKPGIVATPRTVPVPEGGSGTFTIRLTTQPSEDVDISIQVRDESRTKVSEDVTVDTDSNKSGNQNTLKFTTSNWSTDQTVTLSAAEDDDAVDDYASVLLWFSGADEYVKEITYHWMGADVDDDETAAVVLSRSEVTVAEGSSSTFTAKLGSKPSASVTVTFARTGGTSDLSLDTNSNQTGNQNTLTFTTSNWNTTQTVTLAAASDDDAADEEATFSATPSGGGYDSVPYATLTGKINDDETPALKVSKSTLTIPEGTSQEINVNLSHIPTSDVQVDISSSNADVIIDTQPLVSGNQTSLTIFRQYWSASSGVTVTVSASQDHDAADDTATLTIDASGRKSTNEYDSVADETVAVTVTDDDTAGLTVSKSTLSINEGSSGDFTVKLATQPTDDVTVAVSSSDTYFVVDTDSNTTGNQDSLTFTSTNWNSAQTVSVSASQDNDAVEESATLTINPSGGDYGSVANSTLAVDVVEDETAGLTISKTKLSFDEGSNGSFTVKLTSEPTESVTVSISSSNSTVTVDTDSVQNGNQTSLTFTTSNWNTAKTVSVSAPEDDDAVDVSATLTINPAGGDYDDVANSTLTVMVDDDETAGLTLSKTKLSFGEGSGGSFTVKLTSEPTESVTVSIASSNSAVTVDTDSVQSGDQTSLTFATSNWNTAKTVSVASGQDDDAQDASATLTISSSGGDYSSVSDVTVGVTVTDDDTAGLTVSESTMTINEGSSSSFTVRLATKPTASVTVALTSGNSDVSVDTDSNKSGNQTSLTFTTSNWSTTQTVAVATVQDADGADDAATLTLNPSGGDYDSVSDVTVDITVEDYGSPGITLSKSSLLFEEGSSETFTVELATPPTGNVELTFWVADNGDFLIDTDSTQSGRQDDVHFTRWNWNTAQTVTVSASHDADSATDKGTAVLFARGANEYGGMYKLLPVTAADDEGVGLVLSETSLEIDEGSSGSFTVKLASQPTGNVTVDFSSSNSDVTVDTDSGTSGNQTSITYTTTSWNTAKTVSVSGAQDADAVDDTATLTLNPSGANYGSLANSTVSVTVDDDETDDVVVTSPGLVVSESTMTLAENSSGSFTVELASQPSGGDVTVTISSSNADVTVDTDSNTTGNQDSLTFTSTDWDDAQTVSVSAAEDNDAGNDTSKLTVDPSGANYGSVASSEVAVTVTDDDTRGLTLSNSTIKVAENSSGSFKVRLTTQPTGDVTVTISSGDTATVTVDDTDTNNNGVQNTLTFTSSNWNTDQTVSITVASDNDASDEFVSLTLDPAGADYGSVSNSSVSVSVTDDDPPGLTLSKSKVLINEGSSGSFKVKLTTQPTDSVTVSVSSSNSDVIVDTDTNAVGNQSSLTFTTSDWSTDQTVSIGTAQDNDAIDDSATLTVNPAGADYGSVSDSTVSVTVTDDESAGLSISKSSLSFSEGSDETFTVKLTSQPSDSVTVAVSSSLAAVTVDTDASSNGDQSSMTFTTLNWNTAQTVTVSAAHDNDAVNESATLSLDPSGADYGSVLDSTVSVTVNDDESAGLTISESSLSFTEGTSTSFTVKLTSQPSDTVTVAVSSSLAAVTFDTDANSNGDQSSMTFTTLNWNTAQTVSVSAAQDNDSVNESATLSINPSGADYESVLDSTVSVTVTDDESAGLSISKSSLLFNEGSNESFTVKLTAQPTGEVTISVSSGNTDIVVDTDTEDSGNQSTLTFSTTNWNEAQSVSVSGTQDPDAVDDTTTLTLTPSGADYGNVPNSTLSIRVDDDETASLTVSVSTLDIDEGSSDDFTVKLTTHPTGDVTVAISSSDADVTVDTDSVTTGNQNSLTFNSTDWDTEKTVSVSAAHDSDTADEALNLTLDPSGADYESTPNATIAISVIDDDTGITELPGLTLSKANLTIAEGASDDFTIRLKTQPTDNVTVVVSSDNTDITLPGTTPPVVSLGENTEVEQPSNDPPAVRPSSNSDYALPNEGDRAFVNSHLSEPRTLTFTPSNWYEEQMIYVGASHDIDTQDDVATLTAVPSGADYEDAQSGLVGVLVTDDDTLPVAAPGLIVSRLSLTIKEGTSENLTVKLTSRPTNNVTVDVASSEADITVGTISNTLSNQFSLTFTSTNWNIAQTFTVNAIEDDDFDVETVTVTLDPDGANYGSVRNYEVAVTVVEDEIASTVLAWLARFSRTVATQILDGAETRATAPQQPVSSFILAGQPVNISGDGVKGHILHAGDLRRNDFRLHVENVRPENRKMTLSEALLGTSFLLTGGKSPTSGVTTIWGKGAQTTFEGKEDNSKLKADVTTGMIGFDYSKENWLVGVMLSQSDTGDSDLGFAELDASLTATTIYGTFSPTSETQILGAAARGHGDLNYKWKGGGDSQAGIEWAMASLASRTELDRLKLFGNASLAMVSDVFWTRISSKSVPGVTGITARASRLRFGLESSWTIGLENGTDLKPKLEFGLRHDGGNAEQGIGVDVGVGLEWLIPEHGTTLDISGRKLVTHAEENFEESGIIARMKYDRIPTSERGLSLSLSHELGSSGSDGFERLFESDLTTHAKPQNATERWQLEAAWGLPALDGSYTGSPFIQIGAMSDASLVQSLGWRLTPEKSLKSDFQFAVEFTRTQRQGEVPEHQIGLYATARW